MKLQLGTPQLPALDNVTANSGTGGSTFGSDTVAGVEYPRTKLVWGPDGTVNDADVASGKALPVQLRDATGVVIGKAEDVASASADVGIPAMVIQLATPADTAGTDGDYAMLQMSAGRVWASAKIDTALPAGTNAIGKLSANSGVDIGDVDVTTVGTITPGTAASSLGKAEDAAHSSGDVGVMALTVRQNTAAALAGTDADYQPLITDSTGRLHVHDTSLETAVAAVTTAITSSSVTVGAGAVDATTGRIVIATDSPDVVTLGAKTDAKSTATDTTSISMVSVLKQISASVQAPPSQAVTNAGTFAVQPKGSSATNVAIADNPVNLGVQAVSSENAAVTTARQVQLVADLVGKLIVLPYANPENFVSGAITSAMTGTTSTSLMAAPAAGLRNYITQITVSNAHATVGTDIIIQDGSGGTTLYTIPAAAVYGGAVLTFPTPLRQPTTATAIYCANVTTGASTKASASGYKGA